MGVSAHVILMLDCGQSADTKPKTRALKIPNKPALTKEIRPPCKVYMLRAAEAEEPCAEYTIEGCVQGLFTWATVKAWGATRYSCSVAHYQSLVHSMLADLTKSRPESKQTPIIDLSPSASMGDTFFGGPSLNAPPRV